MSLQNKLGEVGEAYAVEVLRNYGLSVLDKNVRVGNTKRLEIDLIAMDCGILSFVEVKTRKNLPDALEVEEIITSKKQNNILKAVDIYLLSCPYAYSDIRIDYLFIAENTNRKVFEHVYIKNALLPEY